MKALRPSDWSNDAASTQTAADSYMSSGFVPDKYSYHMYKIHYWLRSNRSVISKVWLNICRRREVKYCLCMSTRLSRLLADSQLKHGVRQLGVRSILVFHYIWVCRILRLEHQSNRATLALWIRSQREHCRRKILSRGIQLVRDWAQWYVWNLLPSWITI